MEKALFDNPEEQKRFDEAYAEITKQLEPWVEAIRDSERITEADLKIVINAR